jgi:type II secretory pathway pseudopilin PulG
MFPIKCKDLLPVDHLAIRSVAVRGQLGPLTVWVSKLPREARHDAPAVTTATTVFKLQKKYWHKVYEAVHPPSQREYTSLVLTEPIVLKPGQVRAIYIHSTLPGDQAIVYDNAAFYAPRRMHPFAGHHQHHAQQQQQQRPPARHEDAMISIYSGRAHVSNIPFGQMPIWGWGNSWRDHREFVGQLEYGAVYQLWNPTHQIVSQFGPQFARAFYTLKACQTRWESPISRLPDECLYYILNMCRWDWFTDTQETMTRKAREQKQKLKQQRLLQLQQRLQEAAEEEAAAAAVVNNNDCKKNAVATTSNDTVSTTVAATTTTTTTGCESNRNNSTGTETTTATTTTTTTSICCWSSNNANAENEQVDDDDDDDSNYADAVEEQGQVPNGEEHLYDAMEDEELDQQDSDDDDEEEEDEEAAVDVEEVIDDVLEDDDDDDDDDDEDLEDDEDFDEDDDDDDDPAWEHANGYRADHNVFRFVDPDVEQEAEDQDNDADNDQGDVALRHAWIRRQFDRIHVLRALARDQDAVDMVLAD